MNKKIEFEEFLASVSEQNQEFVKELHNQLMESGCKIEIKSAKSGYMVSYLYHKKTIANYVFRKKGMLAASMESMSTSTKRFWKRCRMN